MEHHHSVAVLVEKNGKVLLIKRKYPPEQHSWNIPGGHVEPGETFQQAAKREAREEAGDIAVEPEPFDVLKNEAVRVGHQHDCHFFRGRLHGQPRAGDDAADIGWFTFEQMGKMEVSYMTRHIINKHFASRV